MVTLFFVMYQHLLLPTFTINGIVMNSMWQVRKALEEVMGTMVPLDSL